MVKKIKLKKKKFRYFITTADENNPRKKVVIGKPIGEWGLFAIRKLTEENYKDEGCLWGEVDKYSIDHLPTGKRAGISKSKKARKFYVFQIEKNMPMKYWKKMNLKKHSLGFKKEHFEIMKILYVKIDQMITWEQARKEVK